MVNFITTNPYVEAVAKAQDAVDRRDEIAFKREQQANQRDEWDRARVTNRALGEAATAMYDGLSNTTTATVQPPPALPKTPGPQMNVTASPIASLVADGSRSGQASPGAAGDSAGSPIATIVAAPQMSEWTKPVDVSVAAPRGPMRNRSAVEKLVAAGAGQAAFSLAAQDQKDALSVEEKFHDLLTKVKTPADVDMAFDWAKTRGIAIPDALASDRKKQMTLVSAAAFAKEYGAKGPQAGKLMQAYIAAQNDPDKLTAILEGMGASDGFKPVGQPFNLNGRGGVVMGDDGQLHDLGGRVENRDRTVVLNDGQQSRSIQAMEWKAKAYEQVGIAPNIAAVIAANPGLASSPKAIMEQARFLKKQSFEENLMDQDVPVLTMDQAVAQAKRIMADAQRYIIENMSEGGRVNLPAPRLVDTPRDSFESMSDIGGAGFPFRLAARQETDTQSTSLYPDGTQLKGKDGGTHVVPNGGPSPIAATLPSNAVHVGTKDGKPVIEWKDGDGRRRRAVVDPENLHSSQRSTANR